MKRLSAIQIVSPARAAADGSVGITGPERRASNLISLWADLGIDVTILYPRRGSLWSRFADTGLPLVDFELRGKWDWRSVAQLVRVARERRADVIHAQGGPAVDLAAVIAARLSRARAVITRPVMIEDQVDRSARELALFGALDRRLTLPGAAAVVAVSRNGFERLQARTRVDKVRLIFNGVRSFPEERFAALPERAGGLLHVGMVGHLLPYKGWLDFLAVAARVTAAGLDVRWHVVGEGPDHAMLKARAAELGLADRVIFHGLLQDVSPVLFDLDLFLFTSHREGLSVAVLEAMSAGLPIVATQVAGIRDQVIDGENGYVVPVRDIEGLTGHVLTILRDARHLRALGRASRARAERLFSQQAMLDGYASLYREMACRLEQH